MLAEWQSGFSRYGSAKTLVRVSQQYCNATFQDFINDTPHTHDTSCTQRINSGRPPTISITCQSRPFGGILREIDLESPHVLDTGCNSSWKVPSLFLQVLEYPFHYTINIELYNSPTILTAKVNASLMACALTPSSRGRRGTARAETQDIRAMPPGIKTRMVVVSKNTGLY